MRFGVVVVGVLVSTILTSCTMTPIPPPYTQDELKDQCERHGGRWHDGDPARSFCEQEEHAT
jgi:hypothetical protein